MLIQIGTLRIPIFISAGPPGVEPERQSRSKAKDVASLLVLAPPARKLAHRYAATGPLAPAPRPLRASGSPGFAGGDQWEGRALAPWKIDEGRSSDFGNALPN